MTDTIEVEQHHLLVAPNFQGIYYFPGDGTCVTFADHWTSQGFSMTPGQKAVAALRLRLAAQIIEDSDD